MILLSRYICSIKKKLTPFLSSALKRLCFSSPVRRNEPSARPRPSPRAHPSLCRHGRLHAALPGEPPLRLGFPNAVPAACGTGDQGVPLCASAPGGLSTSLVKSPFAGLFPVPVPGQPRLLLSRDLPSSRTASSAGRSPLQEKHSHSSQYTFTEGTTAYKTTLIAALIHPPLAGDAWRARRSIWQWRRGGGLSANASPAAPDGRAPFPTGRTLGERR